MRSLPQGPVIQNNASNVQIMDIMGVSQNLNQSISIGDKAASDVGLNQSSYSRQMDEVTGILK